MDRLDRERRLRKVLSEAGWMAIRASKGPVDLVLVRNATKEIPAPNTLNYSEVRLVQVKSTAGGPYEKFGPRERAELLALAQECGATAWLIHWPPRKGWRWIPSTSWPSR
jgi:Holliday junction resolvase